MSSFLSSLFSPVKLHAWWLRRCFIRAGLQAQSADLDNGVVHCWRGGQGAPLVLLHGFGASALWQWPGQVRPLAAHYDLVIPDLLYFGESSSDKGEWSVDFQAETMMQLLDAQGLERVHLMGLSYGGLVVNRMAVRWPERVDKVIIVDSPGREMNMDDHQAMLERFGVSELHEFLLPTEPAGVRRLVNFAWHKPPPLPGFAARDALRVLYQAQIADKKELLQALMDPLQNKDVDMELPSQETLILWGAHDQIFPVEMGERFYATLGERAKLEVIEGAGHVPNLEKSAAFNALVLEFLQR